jgi:putative phage-type endonuclease
MTAELLTDAEPHSPAWYAARRGGIGSSEIAAVLGISPWTSPFDLYWRKFDDRPGEETGEETDRQRWGHYMEPAIAGWFEQAHPEFWITRSPGVFMHRERAYQRASPDGLIYDRGSFPDIEEPDDPIATLECKSDNNRGGWGEPGTDEIPEHYLAQKRWQLDTLGLSVGYVVVTFGGPPLEYVVEHDETWAVMAREAAAAFAARLERGEAPPIDWHSATTRRLKKMHHTVEDVEVEIPGGLVEQRREIHRLIKDAERERDLIDNTIRRMLGDARAGTVDGLTVVTRSVSDIKEQTIIRAAHQRHALYFPKPKTIKEQIAS